MMILPEPTEVMPTKRHADKRLHRRWSVRDVLFNLFLKEEEQWNAYQQDPYCDSNEMIDASSIDSAQVHQQAYSQDRARNTAHRQRAYNSRAHGPMSEMHPSGTNFGEEVEQCIRAHSQNRRHPEAEDKHGQQQNTAAYAGHSNQGADYKAD